MQTRYQLHFAISANHQKESKYSLVTDEFNNSICMRHNEGWQLWCFSVSYFNYYSFLFQNCVFGGLEWSVPDFFQSRASFPVWPEETFQMHMQVFWKGLRWIVSCSTYHMYESLKSCVCQGTTGSGNSEFTCWLGVGNMEFMSTCPDTWQRCWSSDNRETCEGCGLSPCSISKSRPESGDDSNLKETCGWLHWPFPT
jgi:hypothetical protein